MFARTRVSVAGVSVPAGVANIVASSASASAACSGNACQVDYGSDAQLTADPTPAGYRFDSWSDCSGQASGAQLSLSNLTASASCQAHYIKRWSVTSASDPTMGSTSCASGCGVDQGGSVDVTAAPAKGYSFVGWSCSSATTDTITLSGISADISCLASFRPIPQ
jgi:hypothetical protein